MNNDTTSIIVDVQGFKNQNNEFIIKELVIGTSEHTQIFLIKPPYPFSALTLEERKRVWWIERNRGYRWSEGHIDYKEFKRLIKPYFKKRKIIVKGEEKVKWVRELCEHENVLDISNKGLPNLETLSNLYCKDMFSYNCFNHLKYCALKNVICIKKWLIDNNKWCMENNLNI